MTTYAYQSAPGVWVEVLEPCIVGERRLSPEWVATCEPDERQALGLVAVLEEASPPDLPAGLTPIAGLADEEGQPVRVWSTAHISDEALAATLVSAVNAERDTRIDGGFVYNGGLYQSRPSDRENISALGVQAQLAVAAGAQPGDLQWHGGDEDFVWILADNSTVSLDAPGMVALFQRGIGFKSALTFAGRAKKDWLLDPARTREELLAFDVTADWPA